MRRISSYLRAHKALRVLVWTGAILFAAAAGLAAYRLISGEPLGLRSAVETAIYNTRMQIQVMQNSGKVAQYSSGEYTNVFFLHHSVGQGFIEEGGLREMLKEQGLTLYDQNYNYIGLTSPDGQLTGTSYIVPDDNTDPDGLAVLFSQPVYDLPVNALSAMLQHEVIVFKSCYTAAPIASEEEYQAMQRDYQTVLKLIRQHPEKVFILLTSPPLIPSATRPEESQRARRMAEWLKSDAFMGQSDNLYVFDLFDALSESDPASPDVNTLKVEYRRGGDDAHPNATANRAIAPVIAQFIVDSIQDYRESR
jgi:lysophospholipase L1-like esterase